jgi:hypothetical protein
MPSSNQTGAARIAGSRAAALGAALSLAAAASAAAQIPVPVVTGPVPATVLPGTPSHDYPFFSTNHDIAAQGYVEQEFFVQGTASRYNTPALATGSVIDAGHPYKTRVVVRRPADPARFNGTVLVEWYNVTNGFDAENTWFFSWEHILQAGYAWVGVSNQLVGVNALKAWSPARYGSLDVTQGGAVTGDALDYDIFSQVAAALRHPGSADLLGGLTPRRVIGIGESQSAIRMVPYVNSVDPLTPAYDGFLLLSAVGGQVRPDVRVPTFKISTEYDVQAADASVRQPDTQNFRTWEVAASSHVDQHLRASREPLELRDFGTSAEAALAPQCQVPLLGTTVPTRYVVGRAEDWLVTWSRNGQSPPSAPRMQTTQIGTPGTASVIARNGLGIALGGIQLPAAAVPTALNVGTNSGPGACVRWGYSTPFSTTQLDQLYPNYPSYVDAVARSAAEDLVLGYIGPGDAQQAILDAIETKIGHPSAREQARYLSAFGYGLTLVPELDAYIK